MRRMIYTRSATVEVTQSRAMKIKLTRRYKFPASHRLHAESLSVEQNRATYGKCNNPHGHGHNYAVEVTVSGPVDPVTGMVVNLGVLDPLVKDVVLDRYDHANLNALEEFQHAVPTTEALCRAIYQRLLPKLSGIHLEQVRIEETRKNSFLYAGEGKAVS